MISSLENPVEEVVSISFYMESRAVILRQQLDPTSPILSLLMTSWTQSLPQHRTGRAGPLSLTVCTRHSSSQSLNSSSLSNPKPLHHMARVWFLILRAVQGQ